MPESRTLEGPIHPLARDVRGSHGRQRQGAAASVDRWGRYRLAVGDVSRGVPECHCPTPSTTGLVPGAGSCWPAPLCSVLTLARREVPPRYVSQSHARRYPASGQVRSGRLMENPPLKIGHRLRPDIGSATSITERPMKTPPLPYRDITSIPDSARICAPGAGWPANVRIAGICI